MSMLYPTVCLLCLAALAVQLPAIAAGKPGDHWNVGTPIVGYYCGPGHASPFTEENGRQLVEGGWNIVWCDESKLDLAQKLGLRANLLIPADALPLANPDDEQALAKLDALIDRVKSHPAMYCYWIIDEPGADRFSAIGKVVARIRKRDPAHMAWINLFPTYATNQQLNTRGDTVTAYNKHLWRFMRSVHPDMISYDHYHFQAEGRDGDQYFLNLGMIRRTALDAGVPFMNIIQACTWTPSMRVPNGDELRWLTYTSLAYGAQAIAHYVYYYPRDHQGMMLTHEGKPTPLYESASSTNREFVRIAAELQPLRSIGAYHVGTIPAGAERLPDDAPFRLHPAIPDKAPTAGVPAQGMLLGYFGKPGDGPARATHVLVVNLDYRNTARTTLVGPGPMDLFDAASGKWRPLGSPTAKLDMPPGGGALLRLPR